MIRTLRPHSIGLSRSRILQSSLRPPLRPGIGIQHSLARWTSSKPSKEVTPATKPVLQKLNLDPLKRPATLLPSEIHENLYTLPNILTFTRLLSAPLIGYFVIQHEQVLATSLFVYSCVTDMLDGYIARKFDMKSVVGSVIDPLADKFLMITLTVCLAAAGEMPVYLTTLILGRDFGLGLSAFYYRYISLPPPKTFTRFWDFSIPSAEVNPTTISKYNTAFQMLYIGLVMSKPIFATFADMAAFDVGMVYYGYFVGATTFLSGLSYVFSKTAVKILPYPKAMVFEGKKMSEK
ncbi:putative CDP-alcohol phosphatidyltransferase class-I family protein [Yarrowia sp. C11]|nr:putative CDP-alcohol phosphatidyltransferase class-I family protein [Yarrowia sp. C11]